MKKALILLALIICWSAITSAQKIERVSPRKVYLSGSLVGGYYGGKSALLSCTVGNFSPDFPYRFRFSVGKASADAGDPLLVRRVFINNATDGSPVKTGYITNYRLDVSHKVNWFSLKRAYLYGGPRYSRFTGEFEYVNGNEDFEVRSNQWGFGLGLESYFGITRVIDLVLSGGLDYYMSAKLYGHDTTYFPDGTSINSHEDYTYNDADRAVGQPKLKLLLMLGINYSF